MNGIIASMKSQKKVDLFLSNNEGSKKDIIHTLVNCNSSQKWTLNKKYLPLREGTYSYIDSNMNLLNENIIVANTDHNYLFKNYFETSVADSKAIFVFHDDKVEVLNHNINLFNDYDTFQNFKNILEGIYFGN